MMRRYHRWLSLLFGAFMLWIAATGVLSQIGSLVNNGGFERPRPAGQAQPPEKKAAKRASGAAAPAPFICPADMICRPKPAARPGQWNVGLLHHLHSGEQFGPIGVIVSILSGLSLLFFAVSGLWMYLQMFRARAAHRARRAGREPPANGARWFW